MDDIPKESDRKLYCKRLCENLDQKFIFWFDSSKDEERSMAIESVFYVSFYFCFGIIIFR